MKSFKKYLAESIRTYNYKIKIAGQPDANWLDMFCYNLSKFDPVKISNPKTTPIQKDPYGFPDLENHAITIIDVEFRYPAIEPMIKQVARMLNYDENLVRMIQANYDDSINGEEEQYANQMSHSPTLTHQEMEDAGDVAAAASQAYGDSYLPEIFKNYDEEKIKMAGPAVKEAPDMRKIPGNNKSPMSTIKRQPKPETGASSGTKFK
jgi:hypothetical protein